MLQQELSKRRSKTRIHIPEIKRYQRPYDFYSLDPTDSLFQTLQTSFEILKNQISQIKPQLELKPDRSDFTRFQSNENQNLTSPNISVYQISKSIKTVHNEQNKLKQFIKSLENQQNIQQNQKKDFSLNTKNILRNICNAQNQYILFHDSAQQIIKTFLQNPQNFKKWINKLRFHTFQDFQKIWHNQNKGIYFKLYRILCRKFYIQNAIPYLMNSRIKNQKTKISHIRYLHRFLEGLQDPLQFTYFKKKDKQL